ncbi:MAG: hypothetical protein OHK0023_22700 [Anaerolineae bacterium]
MVIHLKKLRVKGFLSMYLEYCVGLGVGLVAVMIGKSPHLALRLNTASD